MEKRNPAREISEIHRFSTTSWPQRRPRRRWGGRRRRSSGPASIVTPSWSSPSTTGSTTPTGSRFSNWFQTRRLFFLCLLVVEAFGISAVILTVHWAINIKVSWNILSNHCTVVTIVKIMVLVLVWLTPPSPGWSGLCWEHGHPVQLAPHPHDPVSHLSLRQWWVSIWSHFAVQQSTLPRCLDLPGHPSKERRPQAEAEDRPRWHHDRRLCPHGHWASGDIIRSWCTT